jgi:hypothetical protein
MFYRTRKIGNSFYRYKEERWRENGKVKSKSTFLGAVFGIPKIDWKATFTNEPGAREAERVKEKAPAQAEATQSSSGGAGQPSPEGTEGD